MTAEAPDILLAHYLKALKLPAFQREYQKLARLCATEGVDHVGYLFRLSEREMIERNRRKVERRIKAAKFPVVKSCDLQSYLAGNFKRYLASYDGLRLTLFCRSSDGCGLIELIVIDEAERLSNLAHEYVRDLFDRSNIGLILVGMPGIEKRMARYPQFYNRVGFSHGYRPLLGDELSFVLTRHWRKIGVTLDEADFTDAQAVAAIARITGGNFRLLHRLFVQIERILRINEMTAITEEVVDAARSTLLIGAT